MLRNFAMLMMAFGLAFGGLTLTGCNNEDDTLDEGFEEGVVEPTEEAADELDMDQTEGALDEYE